MQEHSCDSNQSTPQGSPQRPLQSENNSSQQIQFTHPEQNNRSNTPMKKNDSGYYYYKHAYETNTTTVNQGQQIPRDTQIRDWNRGKNSTFSF